VNVEEFNLDDSVGYKWNEDILSESSQIYGTWCCCHLLSKEKFFILLKVLFFFLFL